MNIEFGEYKKMERWKWKKNKIWVLKKMKK